MSSMHKPYGPYEKYLKRPLDILFSLAVIVLFWWLFVVVAILVRVNMGSPVLFTQMRPGKDEKIFKMYKFRTMTDERDENGELLPDNERLNEFGKRLRATSLDELPEIFNIIKGDMSLIGPRPLLTEYLELYSPEQHRRHEVLPGLSGYAQVHGRNSLSWEERFCMDVAYVDHISFLWDVKIMAESALTVLKHTGITFDNTSVPEKFQGAVEQNQGGSIDH